MAPTKKNFKKSFSLQFLYDLAKSWIFEVNKSIYLMPFLIVVEICINVFVILHRNYTEIDWVAYMQQVGTVANGTYDYTLIEGDTGPLVYPAGFIYIYSALYYITSHGTNIPLAQYIFAALYTVNLVVVFDIYRQLKQVPGYVLVFMCCASYRIHSIYILRLFNDPVAMVFMYVAVDLFLRDHWMIGCFVYSLGVSIKMNLLLFSPAILFLLVFSQGVFGTCLHLAVCGVTQVLLGLPFLLVNPIGYVTRSFNLGRQFFFKWTVNWRFLPEEIFLNQYFHISLLCLHVLVLVLVAAYKWNRK